MTSGPGGHREAMMLGHSRDFVRMGLLEVERLWSTGVLRGSGRAKDFGIVSMDDFLLLPFLCPSLVQIRRRF